MSEDILISVIGGLVHFLLMLIYWSILSSPVWVTIWVIITWYRSRRKQAGGSFAG